MSYCYRCRRGNDNFTRVQDAFRGVGQKNLHWQIGLFLLQSNKGGIVHDTNSPALTALIDAARQLYQCPAPTEQTWLAASLACGQCDGNAPVTDPLNADVRWNESNAIAAVWTLIQAARLRVPASNGPVFADAFLFDSKANPAQLAAQYPASMVKACAQAAQYQADIVQARYPSGSQPSAAGYDDRVKEAADYDSYLANRDCAVAQAKEAVFGEQVNQLRVIRGDLYKRQRAEWERADAAEWARIAALPWFPRTFQSLAKWWNDSAG
jgi:hypothetical protein